MAFKKIDAEGRLPGPPALLVSGHEPHAEQILDDYMKSLGIENCSVVLCREDSLDREVASVLENSSEAPVVPGEKLPPMILWSGLTHIDFEKALSNFSQTGLQRPIFATTTEHNMKFTVKELIRHLLNEQQSFTKSGS